MTSWKPGSDDSRSVRSTVGVYRSWCLENRKPEHMANSSFGDHGDREAVLEWGIV